MRKLLDKRITIRISEDEHNAYLRAAGAVGLSPSEYLRIRLNSIREDQVAEQIAQLRLTLLDNLGPEEHEPIHSTIWLETLLLLRALCSPGELRRVHAELDRLGHPAWAPAAPNRR